MATVNAHADVMTLLLDLGADIDAQCAAGYTALIVSTLHETKISKLLLDRGANMGLVDKGGHLAIMHAGCRGNNSTVHFMSKMMCLLRPEDH
eukprot:gene4864-6191_t